MVSPYFRSPFTDITNDIHSHQWDPHCKDLEMKVVDCFEAYGIDRGLKKCSDLIKDFDECVTRKKQMNRVFAMKIEREKQYWLGQRSAKERYAAPPPDDSY